MEIRDLEVYLTIAREKNMTRASKLLYMTPQGLSKIVKKLEAEMDCRLFVRTVQGVELTESGECLRSYAEKILSEYRNARSDITHIEQRNNKVVDLISAYGIIRLLSPDCIVSFQEKYPDIIFHYREYPDLRVEELFQENCGNVAFSIGGFDKKTEELNVIEKLETLPIKLLVYDNHPLSGRKSVTIEDLKGEKIYIESREFKIHHLIMEKCQAAGFTPDIVFETSGFSLCHKMVRKEKGISVTVDFVFDDMKEENLVKIPFSDGEYEWKVCMLTRKSEEENEAVQLFKAHVEEWLSLIREGRIVR